MQAVVVVQVELEAEEQVVQVVEVLVQVVTEELKLQQEQLI
jgi:hypothetical protein